MIRSQFSWEAFMNDLLIIAGMGASLAMGITLAWITPLFWLRAGGILSVGPVWVGLAYCGWWPFFGGMQTADDYFGCTMLCMGVLFFVLLAALESVRRSFAPPSRQPFGFSIELSKDREMS